VARRKRGNEGRGSNEGNKDTTRQVSHTYTTHAHNANTDIKQTNQTNQSTITKSQQRENGTIHGPVEIPLVVAGVLVSPREFLVDTSHRPFWVVFYFVWSVP
jgi:hypothetical protein